MVNILEEAKKVFDIEIEGLNAVKEKLDERFEKLVEMCIDVLEKDGKIVFSGVGKSGHIANKLSATFSSTGSRAAFLNPVEAMHGDLGMISPKDLLIAISYSGETDELLPVIPAVKRFGVPVVAITGSIDSRLSEFADLTIPMKIPREACPYGLAPTTSTTALLALGDALGIVLLKKRGFSKEKFGLYHPGGSIGRAITLRVTDIMRKIDDIPVVSEDTIISSCIMQMTKKRSGSVLIVNSNGELVGIFTDGDFRRHAQDGLNNLLNAEVKNLMTKDPISMKSDKMAVALMQLLEERRIDDIPVVDANKKPVGLVDIQDLPRFKLM